MTLTHGRTQSFVVMDFYLHKTFCTHANLDCTKMEYFKIQKILIILTLFQVIVTMPGSMTTIRCIVPMPTDCLMAPSLPRTWPLNTTILETAQSGSTMQGEKLRRLLTKIHLFIEVPMLLPLPSSKH